MKHEVSHRSARHPGKAASVKLSDVALRAGVSVATVSRVLSRPELVAETTREAVKAAVKATGYRMNYAARNLRKQRTGAIVALVPNLSNPFFAKILSGMGQAAADAGYDLLVGDTCGDGGVRRALHRFMDRSRADGIILLDGSVSAADLAALHNAPPVVMACEWIDGADLPRVVLDNTLGAEMAAQHLADLGHKRIGYIGGPPENVLHLARREGILRVAPNPSAYEGDFTLASGAAAAGTWLAEPVASRPTGVVAFSDEMAAGFMGEVQRHGIDVPGELSIVGFDGIDWVAHLTTPLTTVRQPKREIGSTAARRILDRIAGVSIPDQTILTPELLVRSSTGPAPKHRG